MNVSRHDEISEVMHLAEKSIRSTKSIKLELQSMQQKLGNLKSDVVNLQSNLVRSLKTLKKLAEHLVKEDAESIDSLDTPIASEPSSDADISEHFDSYQSTPIASEPSSDEYIQPDSSEKQTSDDEMSN